MDLPEKQSKTREVKMVRVCGGGGMLCQEFVNLEIYASHILQFS